MIAWANHAPVEFQQKRLKEKKKRFNSNNKTLVIISYMLFHHCHFHTLTLLQKRQWIQNWYCMLAQIINLNVWSETTLQSSCYSCVGQTHAGGRPGLGERYWWSWAEEMRDVLALTICQSHATRSLWLSPHCVHTSTDWWSLMAFCVAIPGPQLSFALL